MKLCAVALSLLACATATYHAGGAADGFEQAPLGGAMGPQEGPDFRSLLFQLHRELVEIESITNNEHNVSAYLIDLFRRHNWAVEAQPVPHPSNDTAKPRYNIYTYPKQRDTTVILSSHIDTVPPFYPYELERKGPKQTVIHGRGSVDAKAAVAAQTAAAMELLYQGAVDPSDVALLFVVGEETSGDGMIAASKHLNLSPRAVVFGEPTQNSLATGHKGMVSATIVAHGQSAHSGYPWLGVSANELLVKALAGIMDPKCKFPSSKKYGSTTVNLGQIEGGVARNVIAERAQADLSVRIAAGGPDEIKDILEKCVRKATAFMLKDAKRSHKNASIEIVYPVGGYAPVDLKADVDGFSTITVNYGTDVPNWDGPGDRYLYGPGSILVAHSDHEALDSADLELAVKDYMRLVVKILAKLKHEDK